MLLSNRYELLYVEFDIYVHITEGCGFIYFTII